jgi:exonuclease 3'-5' domain-containing protein 1
MSVSKQDMNRSGWAKGSGKSGLNKIPRCTNTSPEFVTTKEQCRIICSELLEYSEIALDMEGIELGRDGEACLLQIASRDDRVFIFDLVALGFDAFSCGLKEVLETESVAKLVYDCRCDVDALYFQFKVLVRHILDMQVLWHHKSRDSGKFLQSMKKVLKEILPPEQLARAQDIKDRGNKLYDPRGGGCFNVWKARPLHEDLQRYCASDVVHLFKMMDHWGSLLPRSNLRLSSEWRALTRIFSPIVVQSGYKDFSLVGHQPLPWETRFLDAQYFAAAQNLRAAEDANVWQVMVPWPAAIQDNEVFTVVEEDEGVDLDVHKSPECISMPTSQMWLDDRHDCASVCESSLICKDAFSAKPFGANFKQWMDESVCVKNTFVEVRRGLQAGGSAKRRVRSWS